MNFPEAVEAFVLIITDWKGPESEHMLLSGHTRHPIMGGGKYVQLGEEPEVLTTKNFYNNII